MQSFQKKLQRQSGLSRTGIALDEIKAFAWQAAGEDIVQSLDAACAALVLDLAGGDCFSTTGSFLFHTLHLSTGGLARTKTPPVEISLLQRGTKSFRKTLEGVMTNSELGDT